MEENQLEELYGLEPPRKPAARGSKGWKIWGFIAIGIIGLAVIVGLTGWNFSQEDDISAHGPYIGVLSVEGTIASANQDNFGLPYGYQHQFTLNSIDELIADPNNKGLVFFVNTPGGGVYESDELYFKIKEYQEKTGRPVYSYMGSMAASGGYYISAPADKILANRNCWTGSIGVTIGTLFDVSGFLEHYGVKTVTITSGKNKAMGSIVEPLTKEQQAIFQSLVDEAYEQFVGIVSEERGINLAETKALADGRIYTAKQALDLHLIDGISSYEDAIQDMKDTYQLGSCEVVDIEYVDDSFLGILLGKLPIQRFAQSEAEVILTLMEKESGFPIRYQSPILD